MNRVTAGAGAKTVSLYMIRSYDYFGYNSFFCEVRGGHWSIILYNGGVTKRERAEE